MRSSCLSGGHEVLAHWCVPVYGSHPQRGLARLAGHAAGNVRRCDRYFMILSRGNKRAVLQKGGFGECGKIALLQGSLCGRESQHRGTSAKTTLLEPTLLRTPEYQSASCQTGLREPFLEPSTLVLLVLNVALGRLRRNSMLAPKTVT